MQLSMRTSRDFARIMRTSASRVGMIIAVPPLGQHGSVGKDSACAMRPKFQPF